MARRRLSIVRAMFSFSCSFSKHNDDLTSFPFISSGTDGEQTAIRAKEGFDMISVATDVDIIAKGFATQVAVGHGSAAGGSAVGSGYDTTRK